MFTFDAETNKSKMNFNFSKLSQKTISSSTSTFGSMSFNRSEQQQTLKKKDPGSMRGFNRSEQQQTSGSARKISFVDIEMKKLFICIN